MNDCSPGQTKGNGARRRNKGRDVSWRNGSLQILLGAGLRRAVCSNMPECDGKNPGQDDNSPKQACSGWFDHLNKLVCLVFVSFSSFF